MRRPLARKPSLLTSFSLLGVVVTALVAVAVAWNLEHQLERNALQHEADHTADQVAHVLIPNVYSSPADLSVPLDSGRHAQVDALIRESVLYEHLVRVKIWNSSGLIVYSDDRSLVGRRFPVSDDLQTALGGEIASEVSTLDDAENVDETDDYARLLEVYVPIRLSGSDEVVGAFETYHDLSDLDPTIAAARRFVWTGAALGFLALFGSSFTLVRNASRELIRQDEENLLLNEQEQRRRAELAALYDLSRALADAHDVDTILALVTRHGVETVHATFSRVALLEGDEFVIRAAYPIRVLSQNLRVGDLVTLGSGRFYQRVLERDAPVVTYADSPDIPHGDREELFLGLARSVCLMPLRSGTRALGLLMFGEERSEAREPFTPERVRLARSIGEQAASALYRVELFAQLEDSYLETVLALANAVYAKDSYTADHAQRLATMALAVGQAMGMTEQDLDGLRYAAILHDIGKIGIPDAILQKPSGLDEAEWAQMREHPSIGARILAPVPHLASAAQIVRHHHERFDGSGYPDGLAGERIPLGARILTVVDSYSAITDKRTYKEKRSHAQALGELKEHSGTQFDPHVVDVFLAKDGELAGLSQ